MATVKKTPAKRAAKATPAKAAPAAKVSTPPAPGKYWTAQKAWYAGIVCQPDGTAWHLLLPKGVKFAIKKLPWGADGKNVLGANSLHDGLANTAAMVAAGSPAALHVQTLDCYIPSPAEALLLIDTLKDKLGDHWLWTSRQNAQYASYAWHFHSLGTTNYYYRSAAGGALAVRRLPLQSFNPLGGAAA